MTGEVRARLEREVQAAKALLVDDPIRWVHVDVLHLTLRFLGELDEETLDRIRLDAATSASGWRPFELTFRGLGCFPDGRRPRVIWVGGEEASGSLARIAEDLEQIARAAGLPAEPRRFSAHLTIGRVRDRLSPAGVQRLADLLRRENHESYGTMHVPSIELLKSDLRPAGPVYTRLAEVALTG